jgi:hypothetical protein
MMQVNVKKKFNIISQAFFFLKLQDVKRPFASIIPFTKLFFGVHSSFYYQHGQHEEGVIIIESPSSTKHGDPLRGLLFTLAHYQTLLETIV